MTKKETEKKCHECEATNCKLVPHPQDPKQEIMICEMCEYAITAGLDSLDDEPIKRYEDIRGV